MKQILIATALIALVPSALLAEAGYWTDREICRAATKTYFFTSSRPADAPDQGDRLGFISDSGNIYTCRIEGTSVAFYWVNDSGETMESSSSSFSIVGDQLHVRTDMMEEIFEVE